VKKPILIDCNQSGRERYYNVNETIDNCTFDY